MAHLQLTYEIAWARATDEGNRSMRCGGRSTWSAQDYDAAMLGLNLLMRKLTNKAYKELEGEGQKAPA